MTESPRRALLVVDVQKEYLDGGLPIAYPPVHQSLARIGQAMDAARAASCPVIVVQNTASADAPVFAAGSRGWALHEDVARRPRDHFVEKRLPSALAGTDLETWLRSRRIDTLSVAGFMTHNCIDSTVKHALHAGFGAEVLHDACGSVAYANSAGSASAEEIHRAFCVVMQSRFAAVMSTAEWIEGWRSGAFPKRDTILNSYTRALGTAAA
jgi:nicotinamidase-related amidase